MHAVLHALSVTGSMAWEILWALILGFALSAGLQAVVRRSTVTRLLGNARPGALAVAAGLGAASSSCSYAAVALARALLRQGAGFTAAMAFEIASTNLVIELVFGGLGLVPARAAARIPADGVRWDYTTWLNIAFLLLAAVLVARFARTGGRMMLTMMGGAPPPGGHDHAPAGPGGPAGPASPASED
ncbi:MAG TPA: permease [Trebonia sp.]|jgi:uncharacterized membrane protein YraQ (UPF0718 family)|nr:permease [Trebonia sp.]